MVRIGTSMFQSSRINCCTAIRVHKANGNFIWSGHLSRIAFRISFSCSSVNFRQLPTGRPRFFDDEGLFALLFVTVPPCYTSGTVNTSNCTDFLMSSSLLSESNDLVTNLLLNVSTEFSCIDFFHILLIAYFAIKGIYLFAGLIWTIRWWISAYPCRQPLHTRCPLPKES